MVKPEKNKDFVVLDVPQEINCQNCVPCTRLKLMEMGFYNGEKIRISDHKLGLWLVEILSDANNVTSTIALREDEMSRICLKEGI
jgi:Fe2+ transport system protein FeoA